MKGPIDQLKNNPTRMTDQVVPQSQRFSSSCMHSLNPQSNLYEQGPVHWGGIHSERLELDIKQGERSVDAQPPVRQKVLHRGYAVLASVLAAIFLSLSTVGSLDQMVRRSTQATGVLKVRVPGNSSKSNSSSLANPASLASAIGENISTIAAPPKKNPVEDSGIGELRDNVTLLCDLTNEMGNILGHMAYCVGIATWAAREHNFRSVLVPRHLGKDGGRWEKSLEGIRRCFPKLSVLDFSLARTNSFADELATKSAEQARRGIPLSSINSKDSTIVEGALKKFAGHVRRHSIDRGTSESISLPFLHASRMILFDYNYLVDKYVDEIRDTFMFDTDTCCATIPDVDETVFVS
jgi:hypothetical protein